MRAAEVARERLHGRLPLGPHTFLERARKLGHVRLAHEVVTLMIEGRIQEEAVVLDPEALVGFADPTLSQGDELLALGERTDGDRPLLERNRHKGDPDDDGTGT